MHNRKETLYEYFFFANAFTVIAVLLGILLLLVFNSYPAFLKISLTEFFTGLQWNPAGFENDSFGIVPLLVSTVVVTVGSMLFAVPLGVLTALYIAEIATPKEREIIKPVVEILAGIPSVVVGFLASWYWGPSLPGYFTYLMG